MTPASLQGVRRARACACACHAIGGRRDAIVPG
ncbi:hypothetical protein H4V96_000718 [Janthinobacterium sp. CG_23.4]|nr:hypothetical protein [Janthinobacterium sp. CG_23.4]